MHVQPTVRWSRKTAEGRARRMAYQKNYLIGQIASGGYLVKYIFHFGSYIFRINSHTSHLKNLRVRVCGWEEDDNYMHALSWYVKKWSDSCMHIYIAYISNGRNPHVGFRWTTTASVSVCTLADHRSINTMVISTWDAEQEGLTKKTLQIWTTPGSNWRTLLLFILLVLSWFILLHVYIFCIYI